MDEPVEGRPCGCPTNSAGDIRCHRCGEYVNKRCWNCKTPRGGGPCPNPAPSPSVPVESREQPRDPVGFYYDRLMEAARMLAERDATIRELRAEVEAKETLLRTMDHFAEVAERCDAKSNAYRAERDRARDLAAHLEDELADVEFRARVTTALHRDAEADVAALAAHLEAEQAEED